MSNDLSCRATEELWRIADGVLRIFLESVHEKGLQVVRPVDLPRAREFLVREMASLLDRELGRLTASGVARLLESSQN